MMEVYAELPDHPISFDSNINAYTLGSTTLLHCFHCGGRLPHPTYEDHVEPNSEHEAEAISIVRSVTTLEELFSEIGPPDEMQSYKEFAVGFVEALVRMQQRHPDVYAYDPADNWVRFARFVKRWPGMVLDVYEFSDGRLEPSMTGIPDGLQVIVERQSWWSRLVARISKPSNARQR